MSYTVSHTNTLECALCPHHCRISSGKRGFCGVRENRNGELSLPFYGAISSGGIDPIEKKPIFHFLPGTMSFSIGFWGCNLRCPFCQNYNISQRVQENSAHTSPEETIKKARESGCHSISYTYSEPLVHFEYCMDCARLAREAGIANVIVTNGMLNPAPAEELFSVMDAANIDLKSYNPDYYRRELKGDLDAVKNAIIFAANRCHLELTTLLVPGKNDDPEEIEGLLDFITDVNKNIPLHLSRYFPNYKSNMPATTIESMDRITTRARQVLNYVYQGNTGSAADTVCPRCGTTLIQRSGYRVRILNRSGSICDSCGSELHYQIR
ncbi:AmmeMemoRadiSam system radical SAM enzyme [Marispirochaeta sp.]|uniref:AmmeMemoRadiSam system radical SAM enzyme n=1 Tax=Marispirochaeta sp. TaxID=2038653 RepID=UPI0029C785EC|nr:AmmeMemoRadiSam system radical SAM enzyme [Marispirochaeta sp.]